MHFGENQLSPCVLGLSPLSTGHHPSFQPWWVRPSTRSYPRFSLPMDRSLGFGSTARDLTPYSDSLSLFFFSSRRRHTRLVSDWSSDVCSSDLTYPRFTGYYSVPFDSPFYPKADAKSVFPQVYPDAFAITNSIDDKLKAPYTINLDFAIQREFGHGFLLQGAYVGRLSRRSLVKDDLAMATNLVDTKSGVTYRQAAGQLTSQINAGVPVGQVAPIPYFENLWPNKAANGLTATQAIY